MTQFVAAALIGAALALTPTPGSSDILSRNAPEQLIPAAATGFQGLINQVRGTRGLRQLSPHPLLTRTAQAHADDMRSQRYFSHTGLNGSKVRDRSRAQGYHGCFWAENIAYGNLSESVVFQRWMDSRGHRRNMLHRQAVHYGLARAGSGQDTYWVLVFGAPC